MQKYITLVPCVDLTLCRVEGDEVEMIVEAATRSWVGVGWRPADATKSCQAFPQVLPSGIRTFFLITKMKLNKISIRRTQFGHAPVTCRNNWYRNQTISWNLFMPRRIRRFSSTDLDQDPYSSLIRIRVYEQKQTTQSYVPSICIAPPPSIKNQSLKIFVLMWRKSSFKPTKKRIHK